MSNETVMITSASSGIGRELARCFAGSGSDLVLVARGEDRLRELSKELLSHYGVKAQVLSRDLTLPTAAREISEELDRLVHGTLRSIHGSTPRPSSSVQPNVILPHGRLGLDQTLGRDRVRRWHEGAGQWLKHQSSIEQE